MAILFSLFTFLLNSESLKFLVIILIVFSLTIIFLSYFGIETDKFNDQIKERISLINKKIDIDLKKIKLV